jgi:hypothetical protein
MSHEVFGDILAAMFGIKKINVIMNISQRETKSVGDRHLNCLVDEIIGWRCYYLTQKFWIPII